MFPKRIISIVPSQTELLFDLGLDDEVAGITKFCIHPASWFRNKTRVGGTKNLKLDVIRKIQPDLILANKEENTKEQLEDLMKEFPVWISDIKTLDDAFSMIHKVGELTGKVEQSVSLADNIKKQFDSIKPIPLKKAVYIIWKEPIMVAGGDTFINDMLKYAGFENAADDRQRYPELTVEELNTLDTQYILLSSEPFPFKEKDRVKFNNLFPGKQAILVDGEFFSWYGSRLLQAPAYFQKLALEVINRLSD